MQDWVRERLIIFLGDDVMKKMTKAMFMTALILGSVSIGNAVHAEELQEFTLDPMIVTASRMEKMDLDTAAAVEVLDNDRIEKSGAGNAFEVLRGALGIFSSCEKVYKVDVVLPTKGLNLNIFSLPLIKS